MTVTTTRERLERARQHFAADGDAAVDAVVEALRAIGSGDGGPETDLARVCRIAADALGNQREPTARQRHRQRIEQYLDLLLEYAAAIAAGEPSPLAPPLLSLPDELEEQHFRTTVAVFVGNALGTVADLEEEILAAESQAEAAEAAEAIGAIRRVVHTLKAEFGVLQMAAAQRLCHEAETTIDASTANQQPFPADVMLEVADWLQQYLDRLANDAAAAPPPSQPLQQRLRAARERRAAPPPTAEARTPAMSTADAATVPAAEVAAAAAPAVAAAGGARVVLRVEGEFVDSLNEFITEARSHLSEAEGALLAFESGGADQEQINLTFRAFHTIKGVAGFLSLKPVVELAHVAETLLDAARSGRLELTQSEVDLLLTSVDCLGQMVAALEGQPAPLQATFDHLVDGLRRAATDGPSAAAAAAVAAADDDAGEDDEGVATSAGAASASEPSSPPPTPSATAPAPSHDPVVKPAPRAAAAADEHRDEQKAVKVERSVKVNTARLDALVDMVGELVIAQSMVLQDPSITGIGDPTLARNIGQVGKITRDLQEAAMALRMVTVKATFQKMARLVRDVAGKSGKRVQLTIQGEETELDRTVVEQISDPLVHMIRNAVDHGIEPVHERRRSGKHDDGRLRLCAYHQGGSIVIEIADDGRGIDKEKVLKKAIEKGIMPPTTTVEDLGDQEAYGIIFLPGFSTAEKVTDLSGRGVGMDVVRRNIEALRGKVEIESRVGHGTTFRLRLPLTLAIIDGMVLRVGRERYVLPTMAIERSFLPAPDDLHYLADRGECVRVRGEILPVYRLRDVFGIDDGGAATQQGIFVVVEVDGQRACILVDEILGQQQVVIKSLGTQGGRVAGVSGGAIMSDGRVALILDIAAVVDSAVGV